MKKNYYISLIDGIVISEKEIPNSLPYEEVYKLFNPFKCKNRAFLRFLAECTIENAGTYIVFKEIWER